MKICEYFEDFINTICKFFVPDSSSEMFVPNSPIDNVATLVYQQTALKQN